MGPWRTPWLSRRIPSRPVPVPIVVVTLLTGLLAGAAVGYALQRSQLCSHSAIAGAYDGRFELARGWALAVAVAAVGYALVLSWPGTGGLNEGLAFRPVQNVLGGLLIGVGMVVAASCISGLFFKLGSGMLGALVGLLGWVVGELVARSLDVPGPTVLPGGRGATLPGLLGLPRLLVAVVVLAGVLLVVRRFRRDRDRSAPRWQWGPLLTGLGLGLALTAAWALAAVGGSSFGASSVGAAASVADGRPNAWLLAFLPALVLGSLVAARTAGGWWLRGESGRRFLGLAAGGVLLGAGGWIAGGCTLGHGLSGVSQLNVSSLVVVLAVVAGVGAARVVRRQLTGNTPAAAQVRR